MRGIREKRKRRTEGEKVRQRGKDRKFREDRNKEREEGREEGRGNGGTI